MNTITSLPLKELLLKLKTGKITCEETLNAFTLKGKKRKHFVKYFPYCIWLRCFPLLAISATEKTNCITEFLYDHALHHARVLDELPFQSRGPLHGLPFSVKEHFFIKDKSYTAGLYSLIGERASQNAQIGITSIM